MLVMNSPFREFDALFDQFSGRSVSSTPNQIPMDAYRRDSDVWVHLDLPGIAPDSLDVSVEGNVLTVTGERSWQRCEGDQGYRSERHTGTFRRHVTLGDGLDVEGIEADYTDGVLTLRVPVAEKTKQRKINVGTGSAPDSPAIKAASDAN